MMRSPLTDDELKAFLQQQVNDHRMYPSDKLWRNIQTSVHGETRWPALTYISLFIIASLVVSTLLVKPEDRMNRTVAAYAQAKPPVSAAGNTTFAANATTSQAPVKSSPLQKSYTDAITLQTIADVNRKIEQDNRVTLAVQNQFQIVNKPEPIAVAAAPVQEAKHTTTVTENAENLTSNVVIKAEPARVSGKPASKYFNTFGLMDLAAFHATASSYHTTSYSSEDTWRNYALLNAKEIIKKKLSNFTFQFYITPSVSYRRLTDSKGNTAKPYTAIPASANYQLDLSQVVRHSASTGAEVGFALGYKLGNHLTVKGGLQFNVRQYNIEAYTMQTTDVLPPQNNTENLNTSTPAADSVSGSYITSFNYAQTTSKPIVLRNRYYEIATPVGVDWKVYTGNNGNLTVNLAATLQPTYTFDKEPFAVTTDYKNYTDGTSIMRNWNLNSSVEAYISYQLGPLRWQVGPQFRYQHLPTYSNYPIREHLLDYGLKIGFTKTLD